MSDILNTNSSQQNKFQCVIRLTRTAYKTKRGIEFKVTLTQQKRKSTIDINDFIDDLSVQTIHGVDAATDGLYELYTFNHSKDWETGIIDDWEVGIKPFNEHKDSHND